MLFVLFFVFFFLFNNFYLNKIQRVTHIEMIYILTAPLINFLFNFYQFLFYRFFFILRSTTREVVERNDTNEMLTFDGYLFVPLSLFPRVCVCVCSVWLWILL